MAECVEVGVTPDDIARLISEDGMPSPIEIIAYMPGDSSSNSATHAIVDELELRHLASWTQDAMQPGAKFLIISKDDIRSALDVYRTTPVPGSIDDTDEFESFSDKYPSPVIILYRGEAANQDIVKTYMKWVNNES